jgi:hypothetical protein
MMSPLGPQLSEFVLFGASMTEWSFDAETQGPGWFLETRYEGKVRVVNEGSKSFNNVEKLLTLLECRSSWVT